MKTWQHGYELDYLKQLEHLFHYHNQYALSVFGRFKKNDIAAALHDGSLKLLENAACVVETSKVPSNITMHGKTVIGKKQKGDITFSKLAGDLLTLLDYLDPDGPYGNKNCWLVTYAGNKAIRRLAERSDFDYVGYKVTSNAEILSVYFRDDPMNFYRRSHPNVSLAEFVGMGKIGNWDVRLAETILQNIRKVCPEFTNHYSNYNKDKAWSALSLRGYTNDATFITKPIEMNAAWKEAHKDEHFEMQDTWLYPHFPEVRELLSFLDGEIHRVRFMKLAPRGGELQRHTDQVDPDAGNGIGQLARLHFPLKTNSGVVFTTWDENDQAQNYHYGFGECWVIDTRKPHMAINGGTEERIHLVVDTIVTPKLEQLIIEAKSVAL